MVYWLDTSIEEHLVELINLAQTQLDGADKVGHWFKMRELASNHGLLKNFFKDILAPAHVVSFNFEGNRLLCGAGDQKRAIELWILDSTNQLILAWSCEMAKPVCHLKYSPDSTLFCSAGKSDKLVKVWYEANKSYTFMYLKHPAPVTSLEWRRTGRFTPHGLIANVLMTSCQDNRVRLWVQTSLPDLVNYRLIPHFHLAATIEDKSSPALVTHWINNKEMHMTRSLETLLQDMLARILKDNEQVSPSTTPTTNDLELEIDTTDDTLTAESSKKLRHKLCRKINKQRALAASGRIAANKDQNCNSGSSSANLTRISNTSSNTGSVGDLDSNANNNGSVSNQGTTSPTGGGSSTSLADEFDKTLDCLLKDWRNTTDLLFSINKSDGTITSWQIKHLDGEESGASRQVQVETYSCLSSALPIHDATTMSDVTAFSPNVTTEKSNIFIVTQHVSGTLSLWRLNLEQGVDQLTRISGLPISPEWLRDGILSVKFDDDANQLTTDWLAISKTKTQLAGIEQHEPFVGPMDHYKASELANKLKLLPQYHLKQLIDLLAFGKLQRIKAILNHLVNCLAPTDQLHQKKRAHRSRTFSITTQSAPSFQDSLDLDGKGSLIHQGSVEEIELDYDEVLSIEPLTLHLLLQADTQKSKSGDGKQHHAHEEFSTGIDTLKYFKSTVDETLDEILGKSTLDTINSQREINRLASEEPEEDSLTCFNPKKAKLLTRVLTHAHLPGLTNVDQMHLLALADAVAFFDASPDDLVEDHDDDHGGASGQGTGPSMLSTVDSLDDRGLRFLTAMRQYVYLTKCLPMNQRNELRSAGIGTDNIVWAFHSETQDELIGLIPCLQRNKPEWSELKEFGIGWWLRKLDVLKKIIEKVAQAAYQSKQDPLDAALFYLAMKKKTLVCALLRRTNCDKRLLKLFEQDFNDPINRKKALKNAYALLGLHRFEHAAAFFLLAGSIWDAIEVCINNLNDIQLAMVLIRLHDNDSDVPGNLKRLLLSEILGPKGDPFLKSMAHWKLGDYVSATHILLEGDMSNASTFNFYRFLKEQPLVVKHLVNKYSDAAVAENERRLFFATAQSYMESGCPLLAIEVLSSQDHLNKSQAQRMKFICCLHTLLNELNTLNANFEDWFERNIEACSSICALPESREPILRIMLTYSSLHQLHEVRSAILNMLEAKIKS